MILIVQNMACEGPGTIATFLSSHATPFRVLRAFAGEDIPSPAFRGVAGLSHLVLLGGSMSVYQEREFPFLKEECHLLEAAVRADMPTLGICLGAQLTAKVLGAKIMKAPHKEVGWYNVRLTAEGRKDSLFKGLGEELRVFQWHEDMFELPGTAALLAACPGATARESQTCRNQAFRYGHNVYALQFHLEVDDSMIENWFDEYSPEDPLKRTALSEFRERSAPLQKQANRLYENFFVKKGAEAALPSREGGGG